jgi:adenylate cyclase
MLFIPLNSVDTLVREGYVTDFEIPFNFSIESLKCHRTLAAARNIILDIDFPEINKYQTNRNTPLPTDKQEEQDEGHLYAKDVDDTEQDKEQSLNAEVMSNEDFHKYYHGPKEDLTKQKTTHKEQSGQPFDLQTLSTQRQDRLREALEERYQYNTSIKRGQDFLLKHVSSKTPLVVVFIDLVGSTNMSMTLPAEKLVTIITAFSREVSSIVESYDGYVLKYVGDAVIGFFPSTFNKYLSCDRSFECAQSIINVIKNGINPILAKMNFPKLAVKVGMDEGENVVGYDQSSPIDILGYSMNVAAKITSMTSANKISVGDVFRLLHPKMQSRFQQMRMRKNEWKYINRQSGSPYKVYTTK